MTEAVVWLVVWAVTFLLVPAVVAGIGQLAGLGSLASFADEEPVTGTVLGLVSLVLYIGALGLLILSAVQVVLQIIAVVTLASA